jgi:rfaE bifunctional protein nucleotidyltransferase chain/domain
MSALRHPKILERSRLAAVLEAARARGERIVFTNGCFDVLHPGHVDLLARCRALGDRLVLGLNSDESVRRQGKTPPRPINPLDARAFVLAHLSSVEYITSFAEDTPYELILALRPDLLVKGGDWPVERIVGRELAEGWGGRTLSLPLLPGYSTSALIARIESLGPCTA